MQLSENMIKLVVLVIILAVSRAQELHQSSEEKRQPVKRSYVCPPKFIRLSHRCYFFSKEKATWQDAYFQCRDMRSNLAIVRNANQDKLIRRTLSKKTLLPLERWLGGRYDWEQMQWKWAASGKPLAYNGFNAIEKEADKEKLRWHCIIIDPIYNYRWNTRSCIEEKHFICHTKMKIVTNKGKKKLQRQYKADKYNKLNEIPVPDLPEDSFYNTTELKKHRPITLNVEVNNDLMGQFAYNKPKKRKNKKNKRKRKEFLKNAGHFNNSTREPQDTNLLPNHGVNRRRRNRVKEDELMKGRETPIQHIRWMTYKKEINTTNPLYPRPIVEEFNYVGTLKER